MQAIQDISIVFEYHLKQKRTRFWVCDAFDFKTLLLELSCNFL